MANVAPSIDPADSEDFAGALRQIMQKFLAQSVDDMLPVMVISFDEDKNVARVKPLIQILDTGGNLTSRGQFTVPVFTFGGGGALMRFRLKPNDLGWIKANDRDISLFLQTLKESAPNTLRKHQFEDAVLFPDSMRTFAASQEDKDDDALAVFQTSDGSIKLSILETGFKMRGDFELIGDFTHTGDTFRTGDTDQVGDVRTEGLITDIGDVTHTGNTTMTGNFIQTGNAIVTGTIYGTIDVTAGPTAISLVTHQHLYTDTGNPVNPQSSQPPTP